MTSPIYTGGDADAGGQDDVAGSVAGAVAAADARMHELQSDTYGQGSTIGDLLTLPPVPEDITAPASDTAYPQGDQPGA
jgi:hypothetical protein